MEVIFRWRKKNCCVLAYLNDVNSHLINIILIKCVENSTNKAILSVIILFVHIFLKIDSGEKSFSIYLFCIAADSNKFQLFNFQLNNPEIGITFFFLIEWHWMLTMKLIGSHGIKCVRHQKYQSFNAITIKESENNFLLVKQLTNGTSC